jgi:hypothetical protein
MIRADPGRRRGALRRHQRQRRRRQEQPQRRHRRSRGRGESLLRLIGTVYACVSGSPFTYAGKCALNRAALAGVVRNRSVFS